jgi:hypothetical protein
MLAAFWHVAQPPSTVGSAFAEAFQRVMPESPVNLAAMADPVHAYQIMLNTAEDGIREVGAFGDPQRWRFDWERVYTRQEWLDQLPTSGILTRLPPEKLNEILDAVGAAIEDELTVTYATVAITASR